MKEGGRMGFFLSVPEDQVDRACEKVKIDGALGDSRYGGREVRSRRFFLII